MAKERNCIKTSSSLTNLQHFLEELLVKVLAGHNINIVDFYFADSDSESNM